MKQIKCSDCGKTLDPDKKGRGWEELFGETTCNPCLQNYGGQKMKIKKGLDAGDI